MITEKSFDSFRENVEQLSIRLNEPTWLLSNRLQAFEKLNDLKPPTIERVKYYDWNLWTIPDTKLSVKQPTGNNNVLLNDEVLIVDFKEAISKNESLFKTCYDQASFTENEDLFSAFTMAFLTDSLFVYIPENRDIEKPLELNFALENESTNRQVLIYGDKNSSVEIIEKYNSSTLTKKATANIHIQLIAKNGAKINYSSLDQSNRYTTSFIRRKAMAAKDAKINIALGSLNAGNTVEDIQVNLVGQGSISDVKTVALTHGQQTQGINVSIKNIGQNTVGHIFQHGAVLEQATLTFNGIGHILRNAKNSDAQQESRILMLSDEARADANPILLIDEYEVQAGHAASVSRVNQEQLYYLMSRGLKEKQAEKLIIRGFLGIVLTSISIPEVREELIDTIERKLVEYGD